MVSLAEAVAFVFGLMALGFVAGRSGLLSRKVGDALVQFAVAVAVPVLLFRTMATAEFAGIAPWSLWASYFSAVAVAWIAGQAVVARMFGRDARAAVIGGLAAAFSNLVLIGIPLTLGVFGREGFEVLAIVIALHLPVMLAAAIVIVAWTGRADRDSTAAGMTVEFLRKLLTNPLVVGILAGLLWRLTGFDIPDIPMRLVDALANMAAPLALFAMGMGLMKSGISGNVRPAIALSSIKLLVMPAVALAAAFLFGLPPLAAQVAVAAAALPTGMNPYLIATFFGTGQALASNTMSLSTLLSIISTAGWILLAQWVFG